MVKGLQIRAFNEYGILATLKSSLTDKVGASGFEILPVCSREGGMYMRRACFAVHRHPGYAQIEPGQQGEGLSRPWAANKSTGHVSDSDLLCCAWEKHVSQGTLFRMGAGLAAGMPGCCRAAKAWYNQLLLPELHPKFLWAQHLNEFEIWSWREQLLYHASAFHVCIWWGRA